MNVAIMQPYFFPYIGYFQLIASVDEFIIYDNIKYTKKGWINRNRMLKNGKDEIFSLPLKSGSDSLYICQRELAFDFKPDKLLNQFKSSYARAPYFEKVFTIIEKIMKLTDINLFNFIYNSITKICEYLNINTIIKISSNVPIDHNLKGETKVLALCKAVGASRYINSMGGINLYSKEDFMEKNIELKFIKPVFFEYPQFGNEFVPWLSIIDVMMFNSLETIHSYINSYYDFIDPVYKMD